jgi:tetratricopeptide (TPR) repeat protein
VVFESNVQSLGTRGETEVKARIFILPFLAAAVLIGGCHSTPRNDVEINAVEQNARLAKGLELAREAQINQQNGHKDLAVRQYREALTLNPDQTATWNNLGTLLMEQKDFLNAATAFRRAADLAPTDPRPYENLGLCYRQANHLPESVEYYGKSLERDAYWVPSLRGAILGAVQMQTVDEILLERIDRALMVEKDEAWRLELSRYKTRIQGELKAKAAAK